MFIALTCNVFLPFDSELVGFIRVRIKECNDVNQLAQMFTILPLRSCPLILASFHTNQQARVYYLNANKQQSSYTAAHQAIH